jgi:hypothetical protein
VAPWIALTRLRDDRHRRAGEIRRRSPIIAFDGTNYLISYVRVGSTTRNRVAVGPEIVVAQNTARDEGHSIACTPSVCLIAWRIDTDPCDAHRG